MWKYCYRFSTCSACPVLKTGLSLLPFFLARWNPSMADWGWWARCFLNSFGVLIFYPSNSVSVHFIISKLSVIVAVEYVLKLHSERILRTLLCFSCFPIIDFIINISRYIIFYRVHYYLRSLFVLSNFLSPWRWFYFRLVWISSDQFCKYLIHVGIFHRAQFVSTCQSARCSILILLYLWVEG